MSNFHVYMDVKKRPSEVFSAHKGVEIINIQSAVETFFWLPAMSVFPVYPLNDPSFF